MVQQRPSPDASRGAHLDVGQYVAVLAFQHVRCRGLDGSLVARGRRAEVAASARLVGIGVCDCWAGGCGNGETGSKVSYWIVCF